jgi:hypothetical protein
MRIIGAGCVALFIVAPFVAVAPPAHAGGDSGSYSGGSRYGPEVGQTFGHRHRGARAARAQAGGGARAYGAAVPAASLPNESGAPNGGFFVNGSFYPHGTPPNIWWK